MKFTVEHARKILDVVDQGLVKGLGKAEPGKMCVEAAICYSLGLPHGDDPGCVAPAVRAFKIRLNDSRWSSNTARAKGLRALAIAQLGSLGIVNSIKFSERLAEATIRVIVPIALRKVGLEVAAAHCEREGTNAAATAAATAVSAADAAAVSAAASANASAASAVTAADASVYAAIYAANTAVYAADASAATAADAADAAASADAADADAALRKSADLAIDILREMGAPGVALWDAVNNTSGGKANANA